MSHAAFLLVCHGSHSSNYRLQLKDFCGRVWGDLRSLGFTFPLFATCLELTESPLSERIRQLAANLAANGYDRLYIIPLFLLSGYHVVKDIPTEVAVAAKNSPIMLEIMPSLGQNPEIVNLLEQLYNTKGDCERVLLAHGTSLEGGNQELETLASKLEARLILWRGNLSELSILRGDKPIVILPYFLFRGKVVESIIQQVAQLAKTSQMPIRLLPVLAETPQLRRLLVRQIIHQLSITPSS
ncbi:MAG: sirohydrochlorin chelatase [Geminocystis sp.]|nr:sirohydrochlorin chelatase [Geminocystis sp.]